MWRGDEEIRGRMRGERKRGKRREEMRDDQERKGGRGRGRREVGRGEEWVGGWEKRKEKRRDRE